MKLLALAVAVVLLGGCVTVRCDCSCHEVAPTVTKRADSFNSEEEKKRQLDLLPRPRKWD